MKPTRVQRAWRSWLGLPEIARIAAIIAVVVLIVLCTGCASQPSALPARAAIPVECREAMPARPVMPTEQLPNEAGVDAYVQAAAAEIDRREGYEQELATALANCKKTITL